MLVEHSDSLIKVLVSKSNVHGKLECTLRSGLRTRGIAALAAHSSPGILQYSNPISSKTKGRRQKFISTLSTHFSTKNHLPLVSTPDITLHPP